MDYQSLVLDVLSTVATLVVPLVGAYVVKWLNVHIGEKRTNILLTDVRAVVQSVQQRAETGQISKDNKYLEAFNYIAQHYKDQPADKISHLIESAVKDMKSWTPAVSPMVSIGQTESVTMNSSESIQTQSNPTPVNPAATI